MGRTAIIFSPKYYEHNTGKGHPESAKRLHAIFDELKCSKLSESKKWKFVKPEKAHLSDIELVHDIEYIRFVETFCNSGGGLIDLEDTVVSQESFNVALYAVGGVLKAARLLMEKEFENAFALVRPPGHHAKKFCALGFCIFNNVAIAAKYLIKKYGLKRILIFDVDAHHGNGTQETFYDSGRVLYISLHQDPRIFPGTGFVDEIGEGEGLGYNINVPLPFQTCDSTYLKALKEIVVPTTLQYEPQFMLISAGFDGHYTDSVGNLALSGLCYQQIYRVLMHLASETCDGRLLSVLEGGYSINYIGKMVAAAIAEMSGAHYVLNDKIPIANKHVKLKGEKVIKKAKEVFRNFWNLP